MTRFKRKNSNSVLRVLKNLNESRLNAQEPVRLTGYAGKLFSLTLLSLHFKAPPHSSCQTDQCDKAGNKLWISEVGQSQKQHQVL